MALDQLLGSGRFPKCTLMFVKGGKEWVCDG